MDCSLELLPTKSNGKDEWVWHTSTQMIVAAPVMLHRFPRQQTAASIFGH